MDVIIWLHILVSSQWQQYYSDETALCQLIRKFIARRYPYIYIYNINHKRSISPHASCRQYTRNMFHLSTFLNAYYSIVWWKLMSTCFVGIAFINPRLFPKMLICTPDLRFQQSNGKRANRQWFFTQEGTETRGFDIIFYFNQIFFWTNNQVVGDVRRIDTHTTSLYIDQLNSLRLWDG